MYEAPSELKLYIRHETSTSTFLSNAPVPFEYSVVSGACPSPKPSSWIVTPLVKLDHGSLGAWVKGSKLSLGTTAKNPEIKSSSAGKRGGQSCSILRLSCGSGFGPHVASSLQHTRSWFFFRLRIYWYRTVIGGERSAINSLLTLSKSDTTL